jgi:hypothetical protein
LPNKVDSIKEIFKEISSIKFEDGLVFDPHSVTAENIMDQDVYHGIRINIVAKLGSAKQQIKIDIGFGDVIFPEPTEIDFPTLLNFEAPRLLVYSIESAVVEKFEAAVSLGIATSRMKDFYDLHFFASNKEFDLLTLHTALIETFRNRQTVIEKRHSLFNEKFKNDENLQSLWNAFLKKRLLKNENNFNETISKIEDFIEPACNEVKLTKTWNNREWQWK